MRPGLPHVGFCSPLPDGRGRWMRAEGLAGVVTAHSLSEVLPALEAVQSAADSGLVAAGYIAYEAAGGLDGCLRTQSGNPLPLVWFGLFERLNNSALPPTGSSGFSLTPWVPSITRRAFFDAISRVKAYIASGDTYQVNYTFRLRSGFAGSPWAYFLRLRDAQQSPCCAFIETDDFAICSASPELFFSLDGEDILSRPMKGTARRGTTPQEDQRQREALRNSVKDRAENAMIVDMIRNDMGRIARPASVRVCSAFDIEPYPTVFQMTSTVAARTSASFVDIARALFPCASITGAPKVRTMQIIRELECSARGVYTGCVGYVGPGRRAHFNVAIRTVCIDRRTARAEYGVGGGIVWDSQADSEYEECRAKAAILESAAPAADTPADATRPQRVRPQGA